MSMLEHWRELHAQAGAIVNVEEAPVVDLVLGHAMKRDAPELRADQRVQFAPVAIKRCEPGADLLARFRVGAREFRQFRLELARPLGDLGAPIPAGREIDPP